ncbi:hypothetical protein GCM10023196_107880 [Actinoallomurus vinaceus]|uniref:Uncharacterized protein n=1 Tax=Actinoallomurus vinaceus TaxID=1080074 RepID=A0ABP8UWK3_9ACTN
MTLRISAGNARNEVNVGLGYYAASDVGRLDPDPFNRLGRRDRSDRRVLERLRRAGR